jgi:hypothetical protein
MSTRMMRMLTRTITMLAVVVTAIVGVAGSASAGIPSGVGWSAHYDFSSETAVSFGMTVPGASLTGTATWNAQHTAVAVAMTMSHSGFGSCAYATLVETQDGDLPPIPVLSTGSYCYAATTTVSGSDSPIWEYNVALCNGGHCNYMYVYIDFSPPAGSYGQWSYTSATQASFAMKNGPALFSGTIGTSGNNLIATGSVSDDGQPFTCAIAGELGYGYHVTDCTTSPLPFTYSQTPPHDQQFELDYTTSFGSEFEQYMFVTIPN